MIGAVLKNYMDHEINVIAKGNKEEEDQESAVNAGAPAASVS